MVAPVTILTFLYSLWPSIPIFLISKLIGLETHIAIILAFEYALFFIMWTYLSTWDIEQEENYYINLYQREEDDTEYRDYNFTFELPEERQISPGPEKDKKKLWRPVSRSRQ